MDLFILLLATFRRVQQTSRPTNQPPKKSQFPFSFLCTRACARLWSNKGEEESALRSELTVVYLDDDDGSLSWAKKNLILIVLQLRK